MPSSHTFLRVYGFGAICVRRVQIDSLHAHRSTLLYFALSHSVSLHLNYTPLLLSPSSLSITLQPVLRLPPYSVLLIYAPIYPPPLASIHRTRHYTAFAPHFFTFSAMWCFSHVSLPLLASYVGVDMHMRAVGVRMLSTHVLLLYRNKTNVL